MIANPAKARSNFFISRLQKQNVQSYIFSHR